MMGSKATVEATRNYVIHSLGNADELSLLAHGLPDLLSVLLTCAFLVYGARRLRAVSEELHPLEVNQASELSAKDYTCMVEGLPRDPALSFNSLVSQLRGLFSEYGEVISVSVARANRDHLALVRRRQEVQTQLTYFHVASRRGALGAKAVAARDKLEAKLAALDAELAAHCKLHPDERAPCAGVCFVTFNYHREAHACFLDLRAHPRRTLRITATSLAGTVARRASLLRRASKQAVLGTTLEVSMTLKVSVPPPPSQLIWENLQFSASTRFARRALVNAILLLQCALSTWAIVAVTNLNIADVLQEDASSAQQVGTMAWTTLVIVASNLVIFLTAPVYMTAIERDFRADHRETMLATKLLCFQLGNSFAASLSFLWTKRGGAVGFFDAAWYQQGGATTVLSMVIADIFFINPCVEGLRIFDVLPAKAALAPRALAQAQMNALHAAENPLYLPFRMQLLMKQLVYGMAWSYAFPCFYALVLIFLAVSVVVDESGLLRTFRGLITSSDKLYDAAVTQMLPAALVLHCTLSFFTAHHMEMQNRDLILPTTPPTLSSGCAPPSSTASMRSARRSRRRRSY